MSTKPTTVDQVWVRRKNRSVILDCLRTNTTLSRAGLAAKTGLNPSTVSNIINELLLEGLVRETELLPSANGRPGRLLELDPQGGCAIGVEINVDYLSVVLTDFRANLLWRRRTASNPEAPQEVILKNVEKLVAQAIKVNGNYGLRPLGIGVGLPGLVDLQTGCLKLAPNLKWQEVPMRQLLTNRFSLPVFVENEANAAALAEYYFGAARGVESFIYLSAGIGLGGGILIDGKLFRGSRGYAGEVGHMVIQPDGELCGCGRKGCWETLVGPRAILRKVRRTLQSGAESKMVDMVKGDIQSIDFETVLSGARAEDRVALDALDEVGRYLGMGMANLVNIFNPELIVLGGALNQASPFLLPVTERTMCQETLIHTCEHIRIISSAHGTDACVMGAVALVLDEILRETVLN